jgi:hypothetical protein
VRAEAEGMVKSPTAFVRVIDPDFDHFKLPLVSVSQLLLGAEKVPCVVILSSVALVVPMFTIKELRETEDEPFDPSKFLEPDP